MQADVEQRLKSEDVEAVIQPLLAYIQKKTLFGKQHQHSNRALNLVATIRQASNFIQIINLCRAEMVYYPGVKTLFVNSTHLKRAATDQEFSKIAASYSSPFDSGYYTALLKTASNALSLETNPEERHCLHKSYR